MKNRAMTSFIFLDFFWVRKENNVTAWAHPCWSYRVIELGRVDMEAGLIQRTVVWPRRQRDPVDLAVFGSNFKVDLMSLAKLLWFFPLKYWIHKKSTNSDTKKESNVEWQKACSLVMLWLLPKLCLDNNWGNSWMLPIGWGLHKAII